MVVEHPIGNDGSGNAWSYYTYYQHLSEFTVADGSFVSAGATIAKTGNSGTSTGPHLHVGMVLGRSGQYDSIYALENAGWVTTAGFHEGRILNNPALNSPAGEPYFPYGNNVRLHAGSVMYTRNASEVSIGETKKTYATVTEGKYAIKCPAAEAYITVQDNVDAVGQNILATPERNGFEIKKSTTTEGYSIRPLCSVGGKVNVYTEYVTNGNNVCLWDDTGHVSQRWYFEAVSGGYVIRSVQTPSCVLTVEGNGNIGVATYAEIPGQIWTLETFCTSHNYSPATCTTPKICTECGATSGSALGHTYDAGKVTKAATCKTAGVKTYTCKACGGTKTVAVAKLTTHTYSNNCDTTCNVCNAKRTITHSYKTTSTKATLSKNGSIVKKCMVCGTIAGAKTISYPKTIKLNATSYTYNGKVKTPTVIVKDAAGKTLTKGTDYTVTYASGRKKAGTYKVTVKMKGNYTGTKVLSFKIKPVNISKCFTKLYATSYTYNGKVKTPTVTVKDATGKTLKKGTDYTATYSSGRKAVGTYMVVVKMKGNYTGTKTLTFKIVPRAASINKLTAKSKAISVKLNRSLKQSTGYQIQYSTSSKFTSAKTVNVTSYKTSSKTISGLKKSKKYYVRVRTYKTVDGTKYYSNWSSYKSIKTK